MLTQEIVQELLTYDPETGKLFWNERKKEWFKSEGDWKSWNDRYAGEEAFTCLKDNGYKNGKLLGRSCVAHRIAWLYTYGKLPKEIEHINGDRSDNRLENLRKTSMKHRNYFKGELFA